MAEPSDGKQPRAVPALCSPTRLGYTGCMGMQLYIGTSGWHYNDWLGAFYPADITGYRELTHHARFFNSVENNSSFYRIPGETTYRTWNRMTPEGYKFSIKLNKFITHTHSLELTAEVRQKIEYILASTQVLGDKLGAVLIQMPASFRYDPARIDAFLQYFAPAVRTRKYVFDIAVELRNRRWFTDETYRILEKHNIALVDGQSSRWPEMRRITADVVYIRMHGPGKLFASSYSDEQLAELATYIKTLPAGAKRTYVYFNNDFHGYAIANAKTLMRLLDVRVNPPA